MKSTPRGRILLNKVDISIHAMSRYTPYLFDYLDSRKGSIPDDFGHYFLHYQYSDFPYSQFRFPQLSARRSRLLFHSYTNGLIIIVTTKQHQHQSFAHPKGITNTVCTSGRDLNHRGSCRVLQAYALRRRRLMCRFTRVRWTSSPYRL